MRSFFIILLLTTNVYADIFYKGQIATELRVFKNDHNSYTKDYGTALAPKFEVLHETQNWLSKVRFSGRHDFAETNRNILIPEDIYTGYNGEKWLIFAGYQILNWSATEAFHPADVINARNFDSNLENAEKIGELMLQTTYLLNSGSLNFYLLPRIQGPNLPDNNNRLSFFSPGLNVLKPKHLDSDGKEMNDKWDLQWATRFEQSFDGIDLAFYTIQHQDRYNPIAAPSGTSIQLYTVPRFQYGITYQQAIDAFVLKLETATIDFDNYGPLVAFGYEAKDNTQIAFGLDYTYSHSSGTDSTFIFEAMSVIDLSKPNRAIANTFQRDVLFGYRYAWNDILAKEFFISLIADLERGREYLFSTSYSQRLSDVWGIKGSYRYIDAPQKEAIQRGLEILHKDHQVSLTTTRYF